jgi:hypothetical protein
LTHPLGDSNDTPSEALEEGFNRVQDDNVLLNSEQINYDGGDDNNDNTSVVTNNHAGTDDVHVHANHTVDVVDITHQAATWILKTSECRCLTRSATIGIIEDVSYLIDEILTCVKDRLIRILQNNLIDTSIIEPAFDQQYSSPFSQLQTFHQQLQYYKANFKLIEPERLILQEHCIQKQVGTKRRLISKKDELIFIPLLATLQQMLNNALYLQEVLLGHDSDDPNILGWLSFFRKCDLLKRSYTVLQIILNYDELEICNPLGSRRKKQTWYNYSHLF